MYKSCKISIASVYFAKVTKVFEQSIILYIESFGNNVMFLDSPKLINALKNCLCGIEDMSFIYPNVKCVFPIIFRILLSNIYLCKKIIGNILIIPND